MHHTIDRAGPTKITALTFSQSKRYCFHTARMNSKATSAINSNGLTHTIPALRRLARSASSYPKIPPKTSSVCSPRSGGLR